MRRDAHVYHKLARTIIAALVFPVAAAGEDVRVLFIPSQNLAAQVQTQALEKAIAEAGGSLRTVKDLAAAEVVIQFIAYRVEQKKKDGPWRWWEGQARVLLPPEVAQTDAVPRVREPERFSLVIMGEDGLPIQRAVAALEQFLRKALGRQGAKHDRGVVDVPPNNRLKRTAPARWSAAA